MDSYHSTYLSLLNFIVAYFAKQNVNVGDFRKRAIRKPARIPPQTTAVQNVDVHVKVPVIIE